MQEQDGKITVFKDMVYMCRETAGVVQYSGTCFHSRHKAMKKETLWFIGSGAWPSRDDPALKGVGEINALSSIGSPLSTPGMAFHWPYSNARKGQRSIFMYSI